MRLGSSFILCEQFNLYSNLFHTPSISPSRLSFKNIYTINNGFQDFRVL